MELLYFLTLLHSTVSTFSAVTHEGGGTVMAGEGMRREEDFKITFRNPLELFFLHFYSKKGLLKFVLCPFPRLA